MSGVLVSAVIAGAFVFLLAEAIRALISGRRTLRSICPDEPFADARDITGRVEK